MWKYLNTKRFDYIDFFLLAVGFILADWLL